MPSTLRQRIKAWSQVKTVNFRRAATAAMRISTAPALNSVIEALVEEASSADIVGGMHLLIDERLQRLPGPLKLFVVANAGKHFLPDDADDRHATASDRFFEFGHHPLLIGCENGSWSATERQGPDTCVDQEVHFLCSRSRSR